jgi:TetR/AcrR family tetracycline transcriptional repressor
MASGRTQRRPRGRPRAGPDALTHDGIVRAAIRLVDEHGMPALSMRRLARELGVDPMAIYHHLPGKAAVVSGMVRTVFADLVASTSAAHEETPWQERVRVWALGYVGVARAHPNLTLAITADVAAATEATLLASEPLFAALEAGGLAPEEIVQAAGVIVDYVHGWMLGAADWNELDFMERIGESSPVMRRVYAAVAPDYGGQSVEAGLEMILLGIERLTPRGQ